MSGSKKRAQMFHASRRFGERTGLRLTKDIVRQIIRLIQTGRDATFVERQSSRVTVWDVRYNEETYRIVYDKVRKSIVTVLTTDLTPLERKLYGYAPENPPIGINPYASEESQG